MAFVVPWGACCAFVMWLTSNPFVPWGACCAFVLWLDLDAFGMMRLKSNPLKFVLCRCCGPCCFLPALRARGCGCVR